MTKRQYVLIVLLAFIGGFIGGPLPVKDFMVAAAGDSEKAPKIVWENLPDKDPVDAEKQQKKINLDKLWNKTHGDESPAEAEERQKRIEAHIEAQKEWEARVKKWEETKGKEWRKGLKDIGRFQFHSRLPCILDTKEGHLWYFSSSKVNYMEQILPGKGF